MNKTIQVFLIGVYLLTSALSAQNTITGTITENGEPLPGVSVLVKGTTNGTSTDFEGIFSLSNVESNAVLIISYTGYSAQEYELEGKTNVNIEIGGTEGIEEIMPLSVGGSVSQRNFWIGAKIGYNFIGNTDDNFFVGSASLAMNVYDDLGKRHQLAVVGNIGNFKFDKEGTNSEDLKKVAQSINGLSVGLGYTYNLNDNENTNSTFRTFAQTGVRLTSFDDIGEQEETINLAQSATTLGLEWELEGFKKKGTISVSTGVSMYLFDGEVYNSIFEEDRDSLFTVDFTVILPISDQIGFFTNGTFSRGTSAAYILGVIFKS